MYTVIKILYDFSHISALCAT